MRRYCRTMRPLIQWINQFPSSWIGQHWHEMIGDPTLAIAILDLLLHSAHKIK